jgi:hypothetical protein
MKIMKTIDLWTNSNIKIPNAYLDNRNIDFWFALDIKMMFLCVNFFSQILKRFKLMRADNYSKFNLRNLQNLRETIFFNPCIPSAINHHLYG